VLESPASEAELLERAENIAGKTLQHIANLHNIPVPDNLLRSKGWIGELIEISLGATAGSLPEPDFQSIGVELKTLPLNINQQPKESTYVCTVSLTENKGTNWDTSLVKKKLSRVLWIPVEADPAIPLAERRVGSAILWSPTAKQEGILRNDWQELMDMIDMGRLDQLTAQHGQYLQIRPKAANAKALRSGIDEQGEKIMTLPRGFYLRTSFTRQIISNT